MTLANDPKSRPPRDISADLANLINFNQLIHQPSRLIHTILHTAIYLHTFAPRSLTPGVSLITLANDLDTRRQPDISADLAGLIN